MVRYPTYVVFTLFGWLLVVETGTLSEKDCDTIRACRSPLSSVRWDDEPEKAGEGLEENSKETENGMNESSNQINENKNEKENESEGENEKEND